jgi:predicted esterase
MEECECPHGRFPYGTLVSVLTGYRFDIASLDFNPTEKPVEDEKGMLKTRDALNKLVVAEINAGVPADRIVLGGFSQGGAMALLTGLTIERRLAGLVVLSGWAPVTDRLRKVSCRLLSSSPTFPRRLESTVFGSFPKPFTTTLHQPN